MAKRGNRWSDKEWREAIRLAVHEEDESGVKKLRRLATVLVNAALEGKMDALQEIGNRLDGKPAQEIDLDATVTHDLADLTDAELADRIKRELGALAGRGKEAADQGKLH